MADSTDKKTKNRLNSLDRDLDAMLDEAELSIAPLPGSHSGNQPDEDEDAIDRLLMDAGFYADEELPPRDVTDASNDYDEFGDDYDLTGMTPDGHSSYNDSYPSDESKEDSAFPLELIESIGIAPNEQQPGLPEDGDEDLQNVLLHSDEIANKEDGIAVFDETELTGSLEEFSDFDEFSDFQDDQNPDINDNNPEPSFSMASGSPDLDRVVAQEPTEPTDSEQAYPAGHVAEPAANNLTAEYDEFGDDADDFYNDVPLSPAAEKIANSSVSALAAPRPIIDTDDVPAMEFDITADIDDDEFTPLDQVEDQSITPEIKPGLIAAEALVNETAAGSASLGEDAAAAISALMQFKSEQETLNKNAKKQQSESAAHAKKMSMVAYASLAFGLISLTAAVILGIMAYGAKSEIAKLTESSSPPKNIKSANAEKQSAPAPEHSANVPPDHQSEAIAHSPAPAIAETPIHEAAHNSAAATVNHDTEHKVSETVDQPKIVLPHQATLPAEKPQTAAGPEANEHLPAATAGPHTENQPAEPQKLAKQEQTAQKTSLTASAPPTAEIEKTAPPSDAVKNPQAEPEPAAPQESNTTKVIEKKTPAIAAKKRINAKKQRKPASTDTADWTVNLIAYKQQWYAGSKAAEFKQKGVPVEIVTIQKNNEMWYRLRVSGFNDREEASAYKARVEKALNLSGVWVGNK